MYKYCYIGNRVERSEPHTVQGEVCYIIQYCLNIVESITVSFVHSDYYCTCAVVIHLEWQQTTLQHLHQTLLCVDAACQHAPQSPAFLQLHLIYTYLYTVANYYIPVASFSSLVISTSILHLFLDLLDKVGLQQAFNEQKKFVLLFLQLF